MTIKKDGKLPIAKKRPASAVNQASFGDHLIIPTPVKKWLDENQLVARWVDAKKVYENAGYHEKEWFPIQVPKEVRGALPYAEFKMGSDPDGIIRRGSMILAAKNTERVEAHQRILRAKADRLHNHDKSKAQEMRSAYGKAGVKIIEGFDENNK